MEEINLAHHPEYEGTPILIGDSITIQDPKGWVITGLVTRISANEIVLRNSNLEEFAVVAVYLDRDVITDHQIATR